MLTIPKHRSKLSAILESICSSKYWKSIWFKGWTLAYFLYWLDRFSTDLDFDLLGDVDEGAMIADFQNILSQHGVVKDYYNKQWTLFWLLDYESWEMNIKIEINKRTRKNDHFSLKKILWTEVFCMDEWSMFANKLVALMERKRTVSRDLYDINFFFRKGFPINDDLILERTRKDTKTYLIELKTFIHKTFNPTNVLAWLGEVIDNKQKTFVKEKLLENTLWYIDLYLRN